MKKKMKAIRIILAVIVLSTVLLTACSDKKKQQSNVPAKSDAKYTCPMHPQILEDHPGSCPICGMTLVKKSGQASEGSGISLNTVLQPVNSNVISNVNFVMPEQKEVPTVLSAEGYLDFDTHMFNNIASRYSGRIEKLYIKYAFQEIHQGQRIFDIYSPDMVTAQQDLIYLVKNSPAEASLIDAAKQKLLLLGMTNAQVSQVIQTGKAFYNLPVYSPYDGHVHDMPHSQMTGASDSEIPSDFANNVPLSIKEGMYVAKEQNLFNVVNPHMLWAIIKIDQSALSGVKLNQPVTITLPDIPDKVITGKVDFIEPVLREGDKTISIRVYLDNMDHELKVNSLVKAEIKTGKTNGLWIPRTAVVDLGRTRIVWLKNGQRFRAKQVTTGIINNDEVLISNGLKATDSVAANAQYLTDSESFIKTKGDE
jgi:Cu(I)/Ag(I) efflux system membrane fusion protein